MSFKTKISSMLAIVFAFASFSVAVSAQTSPQSAKVDAEAAEKMEHHGGRHGGRGEGMRGGHEGAGFMRELRGINLTDAQKAQLRTIHEANKPDQATMAEMKSLMEAKRSGGTLTDDQKDRMKTLHQQARANREQVQAQVLAILTPEQRAQVETNRQQQKQRREERRENRKTEKDKPTDN